MSKEEFKNWWEENGKRGISFCECNYSNASLKEIRQWVQEFKGVTNPTPRNKPKTKNKVTIIQGGCFHFPKHDPSAVSCFLQVAKYLKADYAVLSGDIADNSRHSNHNTDLDVLMTEALRQRLMLREFLINLKEKVKNVIYIRGNHEVWIDDKKALDIGLMYDDGFTVPKVLGFDDLGIQYEPDLWEYNDFVFKHGDSIASGDNCSKAEFMGELKNGASSHTHRSARYRHTTRTHQYVWYTTGCMCKLNMWYKLKGKSKINSGWNHSFNVFKFIGKQFQCTQVEIIDGVCIYDGKLFDGNKR